MSGRHIGIRMGIDRDIEEILEKRLLNTTDAFFSKTDLELMYDLDLPYDQIQAILSKVRASLIPECQTLFKLTLKKDSRDIINLKTGICLLDWYLRGGIHFDSLTEIAGQSGSGKTQFVHMLAILATRSIERGGCGKNRKVLFIDTENTFSAKRLIEMAHLLDPEYFNSDEILADSLDRVICQEIFSLHSFSALLLKLPELIIEEQVQFLIIDSVASLVQSEYESENMNNRQNFLHTLASNLKTIAEKYNIPVVLTNQLLSSFANSNNYNYCTPALGTLWSHCINTRFILSDVKPEVFGIPASILPQLLKESFPSYFKDHDLNMHAFTTIKSLVIAKSPISPVVKFPYFITERGLVPIRRIEILKISEDDSNDINDFISIIE